MHDLRDVREHKATDEESEAYSLPEDVPNEKLFSKEEVEEHLSSLSPLWETGNLCFAKARQEPSSEPVRALLGA
jgi:hypothetical protein